MRDAVQNGKATAPLSISLPAEILPLVRNRARGEAMSMSCYVRRLVLRDLRESGGELAVPATEATLASTGDQA